MLSLFSSIVDVVKIKLLGYLKHSMTIHGCAFMANLTSKITGKILSGLAEGAEAVVSVVLHQLSS
jgi:hypothetical protein